MAYNLGSERSKTDFNCSVILKPLIIKLRLYIIHFRDSKVFSSDGIISRILLTKVGEQLITRVKLITHRPNIVRGGLNKVGSAVILLHR